MDLWICIFAQVRPCMNSGDSDLVTQLCPTRCDSMDCSPAGSSVRGNVQARVLEWVAVCFSGRQGKAEAGLPGLPTLSGALTSAGCTKAWAVPGKVGRRAWAKSQNCVTLRLSLTAQSVKDLPAMQETQVWFPGPEDPLEKEMATHSSILAWRIPWTEEPGGLQPTGSLSKLGHNLVTKPPPPLQNSHVISSQGRMAIENVKSC